LRNLKYKYFKWRKSLAQDDMDIVKGFTATVTRKEVTEDDLEMNISFRIAKAKRDYYNVRMYFIH
jgi:hypothetical protein